MNRKYLAAVILFFLTCLSLPADDSRQDDYLEIYLLIVGNGPELYTYFGHIGFLVRDARGDIHYLYDYGNFSFREDNFYRNIAAGRLYYKMMRMYADPYLKYIEEEDRDIRIYHLNIPFEREKELVEFLDWNNIPENRSYLYHFFNDNCSTRIRDLLDDLTDGQLKAAYSYETGHTFRQIGRIYAAHNPGWDWLIDYLLSGVTDKPITCWDEMFIPFMLEEAVLDFTYTNDRGETVPLIDGTEYIRVSGTYTQPSEIRSLWYRGLFIGLFLSALILTGWFLKRKGSKAGKNLYGIMNGIIAAVFSILGSILFFMMFFSDHDYTYGNLNIFLINPFPVAVLPLLLYYKKNPGKGSRLLAGIWSLFFLGVPMCLIFKAFPALNQPNAMIILTVLPIYLSLTVPELFFPENRKKIKPDKGRKREDFFDTDFTD